MKNRELFYCYSRQLKEFLEDKNIIHKYFDVHYETKKLFWVYIQNQELSKALTEFSTINKNKRIS